MSKMNSKDAFNLVKTLDFTTVLDVGSGGGEHAEGFKEAGKIVTTISLADGADIKANYMTHQFDNQFDCIWASHVMEHQLNVGNFINKMEHDLKDNGILAVTVPPLKHNIVGGHLTLWNAGLVLYNLVINGWDCSEAMVKTYGYNISVIVRKKMIDLPDNLHYDSGDIEKLAQFFPKQIGAKQRFDGRIDECNWGKWR
jgi:SAM-dependent methyltransferase